MKATGLVRRVDDLGRIIIPKELRRTLRIKEGTPLEFFIDDGGICLLKYKAYEDITWDTADKIISPIISGYSILDCHGDMVKCNGVKVKTVEEAEARDDLIVKEIRNFENTLAYIVVSKSNSSEKIDLAAQVLTKFLEESEV